jgi:hypothetical protein
MPSWAAAVTVAIALFVLAALAALPGWLFISHTTARPAAQEGGEGPAARAKADIAALKSAIRR